MDQTPPQDIGHVSPTPGKKSKKWLMILIAIIVLGLIVFGATQFFGGSGGSQAELTPTPTEFQFPTDTPAPTEPDATPTGEPDATKAPSPTSKSSANPVDKATGLDRSKVSISILNGSGTAGVAGKGSTFLKDLGWNVSGTGNADNYDYTGVTIQAGSSMSKYVSLLKSDMSGTYTVSSTTDANASSSADITVIIGK